MGKHSKREIKKSAIDIYNSSLLFKVLVDLIVGILVGIIIEYIN